MAELSFNFDENISLIDNILNVKESFDIIKREMEINSKRVVLYYIDGFITAATMQKLMMHLTTIKDFGIFYDRSNATCVHPGKILFEGIEEGCTYHDAKGLKLTATLPEDVIGDVRVMLGKQKFDKWTMENNTLKIDLSDLGRGEHVIQVSGKTAMNYRYIRFVTFYVEE